MKSATQSIPPGQFPDALETIGILVVSGVMLLQSASVMIAAAVTAAAATMEILRRLKKRRGR